MCYLCNIFIFLDPECFKIYTKMNTSSVIRAPLRQDTDPINKTSSNELLHVNTTAATISELQHSINSNENGHIGPTSAITYLTTYSGSFSNQDWSAFITRFVYISLVFRESIIHKHRNVVYYDIFHEEYFLGYWYCTSYLPRQVYM